MSTLDIDTVQAFLLVAELQSFTAPPRRSAPRRPRSHEGATAGEFSASGRSKLAARWADHRGHCVLHHARLLMEAHDRAYRAKARATQLSLGSAIMPPGRNWCLLERLHAMSSQLSFVVTTGFARSAGARCQNSMRWWCGRKAASRRRETD
jgi:hypothetical protein